jgi:hypothetical protein
LHSTKRMASMLAMLDEPGLVPLYLRATQGEIEALDNALEAASAGSVQKLNRTVWCRMMIREFAKKHGVEVVEPAKAQRKTRKR